MTKTNEINLNYDVKCRACGKITEMYFGVCSTSDKEKQKTFELWAMEHSTFPITKQCRCHNGKIMFHDIISYTIIT